jgi:hypothetical protein
MNDDWTDGLPKHVVLEHPRVVEAWADVQRSLTAYTQVVREVMRGGTESLSMRAVAITIRERIRSNNRMAGDPEQQAMLDGRIEAYEDVLNLLGMPKPPCGQPGHPDFAHDCSVYERVKVLYGDAEPG